MNWATVGSSSYIMKNPRHGRFPREQKKGKKLTPKRERERERETKKKNIFCSVLLSSEDKIVQTYVALE